tara:strand:- start:1070 stop:2695 length:1626 start_codon:yes stop_codon:yes gene_type:complete
MEFNSRRPIVYGNNGIVASSQSLASMAGIEILNKGGNAADAAVATAAALNVTEPTSTGIGGDVFALYFNNDQKEVLGINASGRSPQKLSLEYLDSIGIVDNLEKFSVHTITVPGAAAGWVDTIEKWGNLNLVEILEPAISLAEKGFPVSKLTAKSWERGAKLQLINSKNSNEMLLNGKAPRAGELMKLPYLAETFKELSENGKPGFYEGRIGNAIIDIIHELGGVMELSDLKNHNSEFVKPISTKYRDYEIYEIPPNGQGMVALIALNILEKYNIAEMEPLSSNYLHLLIESLRIGFRDGRKFISDMDFNEIPIEYLLGDEYALLNKKSINKNKATIDKIDGSPIKTSDTVYLSVVDNDGNACSFINSNYMGFGTGIIPKGCGFTLQNRGHNFSLNRNDFNKLEPSKRPYHTIIPSMITKEVEGIKSFYASYGVMGGFMQPQGHVQVAVNMIDFDMDVQTALDQPRICIEDGTKNGRVAIEEGIDKNVINELKEKGHIIRRVKGENRNIFGRGQIIRYNPKLKTYSAGSDPRADGLAIPRI